MMSEWRSAEWQRATIDLLSSPRRKQIEEISNNIQEARRIFERLETETRRLVLVRCLPFVSCRARELACFFYSSSVLRRTKKPKPYSSNGLVLRRKCLKPISLMRYSIARLKNVPRKPTVNGAKPRDVLAIIFIEIQCN